MFENILVQVLDKPSRRKASVELELIKEVEIGGTLGCSESSLWFSGGWAWQKRSQDPEPGESKFLFKEFLSEVPWEAVLGDEGVEQSWLLFKEEFLNSF